MPALHPEEAHPIVCDRRLYEHPRLYDLVTCWSEPHESFYLNEARRHGGPVLELACGTGRLTMPLARCGLDVTGLDLSPAMLAAAREKAAAAGVAVTLVEGDMRRFALDRQFRVIFVAINSLMHLTRIDDLRACFDSVRRHLAPGGVFMFDIMHPDVAALGRGPSERSLLARFVDPDLGEVRVEETTTYDAATQVTHLTWHLCASGGRTMRFEPMPLRQIFPQELLLLLDGGGFRLDKRYGTFARAPFTSNSAHQICICRPA